MVEQEIPTEAEIMRLWDAGRSTCVSIVCVTFNQAAYVEDAICGYLKQKTSFPLEIIIHDDASTDGTQKIIEYYSKRYPKLIRTFLQTDNQYSKGGFRPAAYAAKFAAGKYIALCEGDDYWVSEDKLQKQFDALEKHESIGLCVHGALCVNENGEASEYTFPCWSDIEGLIAYEKVFRAVGQFAPTASMFMRRELFANLPDLYYRAPIGDFFLEVFSGGNGIYYFPEKMSVYRRGLPGAWSSVVLGNLDKRINFNLSLLQSLSQLRVELGAFEGRFVKYKEQQINFDLADVYLDKNEKWLAFKIWIRCFRGAPLLKRHFTVFRRLLR